MLTTAIDNTKNAQYISRNLKNKRLYHQQTEQYEVWLFNVIDVEQEKYRTEHGPLRDSIFSFTEFIKHIVIEKWREKTLIETSCQTISCCTFKTYLQRTKKNIQHKAGVESITSCS